MAKTETRNSKNEKSTAGTPPLQNPNTRLMLRISERWSSTIAEACRYSSVPPEFLAALIANESGGNPDGPPRFEKRVLDRFIAAQQKGEERYGIAREILARLTAVEIRDLATSWGLTQIMGYHVALRPGGIAILREPLSNLKFALGLLAKFAEQYGLNLAAEFAELFRCWNTGAPYDDPKTARIEGKTFDLEYVEKGLARMAIYKGMLKAEG